jgi:hypothetical protein
MKDDVLIDNLLAASVTQKYLLDKNKVELFLLFTLRKLNHGVKHYSLKWFN